MDDVDRWIERTVLSARLCSHSLAGSHSLPPSYPPPSFPSSFLPPSLPPSFPPSLIRDRQERTRGNQTGLHHTLNWVLAFSGVLTSAGLWLRKRTWHYIVVACGGYHHYQCRVIEVPSCFKLLSTRWIICYFVHCALLITKLYLYENSSCLIIHLFLNPEMILEPWSNYKFPILPTTFP